MHGYPMKGTRKASAIPLEKNGKNSRVARETFFVFTHSRRFLCVSVLLSPVSQSPQSV